MLHGIVNMMTRLIYCNNIDILFAVHDDCCCAGRAIEFEHMTLLRHDANFVFICGRSVDAGCC